MSNRGHTQKRFTILIRKLTLQHDMMFIGISQNAGESKMIKCTSQCLLNQQVPITVYEDNNSIQLHIVQKIGSQDIQMGTISFDSKNQKILKPLSKQFFSKQLNNKKGYIQYKFIGLESRVVSQEQLNKNKKNKNQLLIRLDQNKISKQQVNALMALINEKDQIIAQMNEQIQRLMKETKKLNKSLSRQKANFAQQAEKNISINLKIPTPTISNKSVSNLKNNPDWQKQKNQYQFEISNLQRKIRDYQSRQKHYRHQIQTLRKTNFKDKQKRVSDLRKQIQTRYGNDNDKFIINRLDSQILNGTQQKKNSYIQQQLAQQIKKIEAQKQKQYKKDIQVQLKIEIQKQYLKEKQRQKSREYQRPKDRQKSRSRSILRQSVAQHRELLKDFDQLQQERDELRYELELKNEQLHDILTKLQRAQEVIQKIVGENEEIRRAKSSLLRQVQGINFKQDQDHQEFSERRPIQEYQKMIIKERKQIIDEKLKAEMQQLKVKNRKDEKQFKQKLQQKDMQIMKLKLSEQHAIKQKQIYSNRIKQIMQNTEGERKNYLQALQGAHKFETQQTRTKQLQVTNNQLQASNNKLTKERTQLQASIKKLKAKLDEREGQWVRLKSIEAQHDYYKTQCQKFEKAHKKFEKQYQSIKQYCQNLEHVVGKKPRRTFDEQINTQRQERYKTQIRNRLEALIQQVKDMESKFYAEQVQIWVTQRTNVIHYYAKKLQDQKARLLDLQNISQQAKLNLIQQKQKQIAQLKDQQLNDIDRKITKLKIMTRPQQQKLVNTMIDKASIQQVVSQLGEKLLKLQKQEEQRKKEVVILKQKNTKLQTDLKQRNFRSNYMDSENPQKRSLSLYPEDKDSIKQDGKKSYIQEFKKSRQMYMNKPFEQLKKINSELQTQKRRLQNQMTTLKFGFEKQRFQFNEKIRTKQRQMKKMQNQVASNQKNLTKLNSDIQIFKKKNQDLQLCLRKALDQLKQVSRNLQLKEIQCGQALGQIKRMQKNLIAYEDAQKKMFEDVKKLKQKMQKKQNEMQQVLQERERKSKQIDAQRVTQIQKLVQKTKELQFKLQKQITQNISIKNQNERLLVNITQYQVKLKNKQQQYQVLNDTFNIYKEQTIEKLHQYQQQNNILQNNILEIADQISKKQKQCTELQIKIQYSDKRQKILSNIRIQLQDENKSLKNVILGLQAQKDQLHEKFKQQVKSYDALMHKIDDYVEQNAQLQLQIQAMESNLKDNQKSVHQIEKQLIRKQGQVKNLQTKIQFLNQKINQQNKKISDMEQQQKQLQNLLSQRDKQGKTEEKSRKVSDGFDPASPMIQRKLLTTTNIHKSTSLVQPPKSNKNISLSRKSSSKQRQLQQNEQIRYSKQGMELKVLRPVTETAEDLKGTMNMAQKQNALNQRSKLNIQVESQQQNQSNLIQINQNNSHIDIKTTINSPKNANNNNINRNNDLSINVTDRNTNRPAELEKDFLSEEQDMREHQIAQSENQLIQLREKIQQLQNEIQIIREQRDGYFEQLNIWKKTYQKQSNNNILIEEEKQKIDFNRSINISKLNQGDTNKMRKTNSNRFSSQYLNQDAGEKSSGKKGENYEKQIQELKNKLMENQLTMTQHQNQIKQLQLATKQGQQARQLLIKQIQQLFQKYQSQVKSTKALKKEIEDLQKFFQQKISEYDKHIENMTIQDMKKDQTLKQTLHLIQKLNVQIKQKDTIIVSLQSKLQQVNENLQNNIKKMNTNKNQYRRYQQDAQLQILRLKQKTDLIQEQKKLKVDELIELGQRFIQIQAKLQQNQQIIKKMQYQMLVQRSKIKQANDKKDQTLEQMKRYQSSKKNLLDRLGQLQMKIGEKNLQIKELTKQTSIKFKKYQIEIDSQKQQNMRAKKTIKQREQHITNLKLQIGNYNDLCERLQKQKIMQGNEITKMQKQIRQIMISYQRQLNELNKDKESINKELEGTKNLLNQNSIKIQALNKEISRKSRQNKQLVFKIQNLQTSMQKLKQKNSRQVAELMANFEIKNDQYYKIKIQLQRQTEHYFSKQCQYLADRQKRQKLEKQYHNKLQIYEKSLKQLQEEFKQLQSRPTVQNWEEVCFQNQLYKNRIQQLQDQLKSTGQQQEERILSQFKRYKMAKQKQIQDLQSQMQKYGLKFHNLEQTNYVLKKDNQSMKAQLRVIMQQKMRMQKSIKDYEEDIQELKQQLTFYKAKRVDDLNKLLNQTYD